MKKKHTVEIVICAVLAAVVVALVVGIIVMCTREKTRTELLPDAVNKIVQGMEYSAVADTQIFDSPSGGRVLAQLPKDTKVSFLAYADNGFYKVKLNDVCGFVNGDFIVDAQYLETQAAAMKVKMFVVNVEKSARMYSLPDTASTAIANVSAGTEVLAVNGISENGFIKVECSNDTGYIEEQYLSISAPLPQ